MSAGVLTHPEAAYSGLPAPFTGNHVPGDVVEIGLLLPADWAAALMEISRKRDESVGQLLRGVIGRALIENSATE